MLLGGDQGLYWSMTQTAKLDITRAEERGLTMGLNEFSGYVGVLMCGTCLGARGLAESDMMEGAARPMNDELAQATHAADKGWCSDVELPDRLRSEVSPCRVRSSPLTRTIPISGSFHAVRI